MPFATKPYATFAALALLAVSGAAARPATAQEMEGPPAPPSGSALAPAEADDPLWPSPPPHVPDAPPPADTAEEDRGDQLAPPPLTHEEIRAIDAKMRAEELRKRRIRAVLVSEVPYVAGALAGALFISFSAEPCGFFSEEGCENDPYDWRHGAEANLGTYFFPFFGTLATALGSLSTTLIHNHAVSYRTRFSTTMLGSVLGLGLDVGMMAILYFHTDSAAALIWPTAAGFLVLPPLGGAIGNALSRRDLEWIRKGVITTPMARARVELSPPLPIPIAAAGGRTAPGVALGGSF